MKVSAIQDGLQRTVFKPLKFFGVGLHTNRKVEATIEPSRENSGIRIFRLDTGSLIPANFRFVVDTSFATVVGAEGEERVSTIEHFMAALYAMEIDNAIIKVDGPELPILDGSAYDVAKKIFDSGYRELESPRMVSSVIGGPYTIQLDSASISFEECDALRIDVAVEFPGTLIGRQRIEMELSPPEFLDQIAKARTFVLKEQIESLWSAGLALGGSLDNAVVVDGSKVMNEGGLRFPDEFARHKALDLLGDLSLLGSRLKGHIKAVKPGHTVNSMAIKEIAKYLSDEYLPERPIIQPDPARELDNARIS